MGTPEHGTRGAGDRQSMPSRVYGRREQVSSELRRPNPQPATGAASLRQRASFFPGSVEHGTTGPRDQRATETLEHGSNAAAQQRSERAMCQLNRTPSTGVAAATIGAATARLPSHSRPRHRRVAGFDDHDAGAS
jgi:hypothetical protein